MRDKMWRSCAGLGALLLLGIASCSGPAPPPFNPSVEGAVKLDGAPLAGVRVVFTPKGIPGLKLIGASAMTDEKGHFSLMGDNGKPGAMICEHHVTVHQGRGTDRSNAPDAPAPAGGKASGASVPIRYATAASSNLKLEIKADQHTYDLNLTR